jgi:hypothetical protein
MAVFRTNGDPGPEPPYLQCKAFLTRDGGSQEPAGSAVLMFRSGRLDTIFQPVDAARPPLPNPSDRKGQLAYLRRPVSSPFVAQSGELPLEDGLEFLSRWSKTALTPGDRLGAACSPSPPPAVSPTRGHGLDASDMQGLALLPFAISLPSKNRRRVAARREGAALLASLRVGEALGSAPGKFAADHPGVRAYPATRGDYAVLSIDLGSYRDTTSRTSTMRHCWASGAGVSSGKRRPPASDRPELFSAWTRMGFPTRREPDAAAGAISRPRCQRSGMA